MPRQTILLQTILLRGRPLTAMAATRNRDRPVVSLRSQSVSRGEDRMSVMSDIWIRQMARDHGMIEPFVEAQKREGTISSGLASYGYEARVRSEEHTRDLQSQMR